jgi:hypothetical protein
MQTEVICFITSPVLRIKLENAGEFNKRENSKTNKTEQLNNDTNRREHTRLEKLIEEKKYPGAPLPLSYCHTLYPEENTMTQMMTAVLRERKGE